MRSAASWIDRFQASSVKLSRCPKVNVSSAISAPSARMGACEQEHRRAHLIARARRGLSPGLLVRWSSLRPKLSPLGKQVVVAGQPQQVFASRNARSLRKLPHFCSLLAPVISIVGVPRRHHCHQSRLSATAVVAEERHAGGYRNQESEPEAASSSSPARVSERLRPDA